MDESDKNIPQIKAKYDKIKDWVMDPKGYFTIKIFPKENLIRVRYYNKDNKKLALIEGEKAIDIYNTIIRENMISSLQHAADMGAELQKAEIALKLNIDYVQDSDLVF